MKVLMRLTWNHSVYRAGGVLRFALCAMFLVVNGVRFNQADHKIVLGLICAVMLGWSIATWYWNQDPRKRNALWMGLDLGVTLVIVASSRWVLGHDLLAETYYGVPGYWMVAAPLAMAIWRGPGAGALFGFIVGAVNFVQLPSENARTVVDFLCMVVVPGFVGFLAQQLEALVEERDRSFAAAAKLAERERLNRIVHDGVLQALAMVEREGAELGPTGMRLAGLARESEAQLRALLQDKTVGDEKSLGSTIDLVGLLTAHESALVTVSTMAGKVNMDTLRAAEVDAIVAEMLANVTKHAGPDTQAWILIEEDSGEVIISVRDNGAGMSEEVVATAASEGRLGIANSIMGRIEALGGTGGWESSLGKGVEWEFRVPLADK
jgi:signal transduction histidine kinase